MDMRAEVGIMTRNILIQGEVSKKQSNGGHVKVNWCLLYICSFINIINQNNSKTNLVFKIVM